jgi:hypothetical protein
MFAFTATFYSSAVIYAAGYLLGLGVWLLLGLFAGLAFDYLVRKHAREDRKSR